MATSPALISPAFTYSGVTYSGVAAGTTTFALTTSGGLKIPYLDKSHIHLYNADTGDELVRPAQWDFSPSGTEVVLKTPATQNAAFTIQRLTPYSARFTIFQKGTLLTSDQLNASANFNLFVIQEFYDRGPGGSDAVLALARATEALARSSDAMIAAGHAASDATAAKDTANAIAGTANTAISTANTAASLAGTAVTTADNASATATAAGAAAATAQTAAATAQTAAAAAQTTANNAVPKAGGTMTGGLVVPSLNGGQLAGMRNRIINGDMRVWQRGTSFAANVYTADRFTTSVSLVNLTVTQQLEGPNAGFRRSLKVVPTANGTPPEVVVRQWIEQDNIHDFAGQQVTASAWVKCSKSQVKLRLAAATSATGGVDSIQNINVTPGAWTKISYTFSTYLAVTGWTGSGSDAGGFLDIGFVNSTALTTSDYLSITGVQVELGTVATPFECRLFGQELALCQRYYEVGDLNARRDAPAAGQGQLELIRFSVAKRTVPTIAASGAITNVNVSGDSFNYITYNSFSWSVVPTAVAGYSLAGRTFLASAELI